MPRSMGRPDYGTNRPSNRPTRQVTCLLFVAVAVNEQGWREDLGMAIGASAAEASWAAFPRNPTR